MQKTFTKLISLLLALATMIGLVGLTATTASAAFPSLSSSRVMKAYTIATHNDTAVYHSQNASASNRKGTIWASDEIHVLSISGSWAYVSYPVSGGRKEAYLPLSAITKNNIAHVTSNARAQVTAYRRDSTNTYSSTYYVGNKDSVTAIATSGSFVQVIYPITGGYRMAWVKLADYNNYIKPIPTPVPTGNPIGYLDSAVGGKGTVTVNGWAFDWDKVSASLGIHVYVGGPAGSGAEGHGNGVANLSRPDVNNVHRGAGNNHGYTYTVNTSKRGSQTVYVYAINAPGTPGSNVLIGSKTVFIDSIPIPTPVAYLQTDSRWKDVSYGYRDTARKEQAYIGKRAGYTGDPGSGCGLLAVTNAVNYLTGKFLDPAALAKLSVNNGYRVDGVGTSWGFPSYAAQTYGASHGFKFIKLTAYDADLINHLKAGGVATAVVSNHFVAMVAYDASKDKILVLDSAPGYGGRPSTAATWISPSQLKSGCFQTQNYSLLSKR